MTAQEAEIAYVKTHVRMHCPSIIGWTLDEIYQAYEMLPGPAVDLRTWVKSMGYAIDAPPPPVVTEEDANEAALDLLRVIKATGAADHIKIEDK